MVFMGVQINRLLLSLLHCRLLHFTATGSGMQVFNFGSINIDHVYRVPHLVKPGETLASLSMETVLGGKGANQSVALARAGVSVNHIGKLSAADNWACDVLVEAGVDTAFVSTIKGPSGHALIQVDDKGENAIILHGGANQQVARADLEKALSGANRGDWLLIQNECNAVDDAFSIASSKGLRIAFNPAPMNQATLTLPLSHCDILIINETEAAALTGTDDHEAALDVLGERLPATRVVLTLGAKGALLRFGSLRKVAQANSVVAVDTTGAGDTFVGYFLASIMNKADEAHALRIACAAGALAVTKQGATPSIPTRTELEKFMATLEP